MSRYVLSHGSRQPWSWLIFDVRQKMSASSQTPPGWEVADAKSDILTGRMICIGALAAAVAVIVIPAREGASPGGKFFLVGLALAGVGKGMQMVASAKRRLEKAARKAKEPNQTPEPTRPSVTDRADARSAPDDRAAHL
jgi:hypothetical protein